MTHEPPWKEPDGSGVCPVPAGHRTEVKRRDGSQQVTRNPQNLHWRGIAKHAEHPFDIVAYRDWTAWENQMSKTDDVPEAVPVPEWAIVRARALLEAEQKSGIAGHVNRAFARYIAAHEPAPVDPLREIAEAMGRCGAFDCSPEAIAAELRARLPGIDDLARQAAQGE